MTTIFRAGKLHPRPIVASVIGLGFVAAAVFANRAAVDLTGAVLAGGTLLALTVEMVRRERTGALEGWAVTLASAVYAGWLLSHFILLRNLTTPALQADYPLAALKLQPGAAWVFATFAVTWAADTGAYFTGRAIGRHKMSPLLSPKKTWEGLAGGTVWAVGAGIGIVALLGLPLSLLEGALLGLIGTIGGTLGDLAESLLKRQAGVKDSGALIPGHGGLLDRVDSLLFNGPLVYYLLIWLL